MKAVTLLCLFALLSLTPGHSADPIKVGDTEVTFEPPAGFKPLSKEIIAAKWPTNRAPAFVVGNESASTTVAYDLKPHLLPQDKLEEAKAAFTQLFDRIIPGIEWKKNEIIEHAGQKWISMEMTSNAIDTDVHNIMLVTGYKDRMLVFNFNSTKKDFPKFEDSLRESLKSIKLPEE